MYSQEQQDLIHAAKSGNMEEYLINQKKIETPETLTPETLTYQSQYQSPYQYQSINTQRKKTIDNPLDHVKKAL